MKKWTALFCALLLLSGALSGCHLESVSEHESRVQAGITAAGLGQPEESGAVSSPASSKGTKGAGQEGTPHKQGMASANADATTAKASVRPGGNTAAGPPAASSPAANETQPSRPTQIRVTLSVTCNAALGHPKLREGITLPASGVILRGTTITLKSGQTAFDALKAACTGQGVSLGYQNSAFGTYVKAIGPLSEKDCGAQSGWTYQVGGVTPSKSASAYKLKHGDAVQWIYVTHT